MFCDQRWEEKNAIFESSDLRRPPAPKRLQRWPSDRLRGGTVLNAYLILRTFPGSYRGKTSNPQFPWRIWAKNVFYVFERGYLQDPAVLLIQLILNETNSLIHFRAFDRLPIYPFTIFLILKFFGATNYFAIVFFQSILNGLILAVLIAAKNLFTNKYFWISICLFPDDIYNRT